MVKTTNGTLSSGIFVLFFFLIVQLRLIVQQHRNETNTIKEHGSIADDIPVQLHRDPVQTTKDYKPQESRQLFRTMTNSLPTNVTTSGVPVSSSTTTVSSSSSSSSLPDLSACLIVMDDNHFLIEWLAYHYHTARLRHLIITSDPKAQTRPTHILDRWRKLRPDLIIEEWTEYDFRNKSQPEPSNSSATVPPSENQTKKKKKKKDPKVILLSHRRRQAEFNLKCLQALKRQGREWTMMIDIDEYLFVDDLLKHHTTENDGQPPNPFAVPHTLQDMPIPHPDYVELDTPCIPIYREQFSSKESPMDVLTGGRSSNGDGSSPIVVPSSGDWNITNFQTLRWRYYGHHKSWYETKFGSKCPIIRQLPVKALINLRHVQHQDLTMEHGSTGNPHVPISSCAHTQVKRTDTPFIAHHYAGTKEQFFYREGDKRGMGFRMAKFDDINDKNGDKETDIIRSWLSDFVSSVGDVEAKELLAGVGELEPLPDQGSVVKEMIGSSSSSSNTTTNSRYAVGDVIQANFCGRPRKWSWAEITKVHSFPGFYDVIYASDCSEEIGTFDSRLRLAADHQVYDQPEKEEYRKLARKE